MQRRGGRLGKETGTAPTEEKGERRDGREEARRLEGRTSWSGVQLQPGTAVRLLSVVHSVSFDGAAPSAHTSSDEAPMRYEPP